MLQPERRNRFRRAFTVLEVTVSISLLAVLALVTVPQLSNAGGQGDAPAKGTLSTVLDVEVIIRQQDGAFTSDVARLAQLLPTDRLSVTTDASGGPTVASVYVSESGAFGAAVLAGDSGCWFAVLDGASITWATGGNTYTCTGQTAVTDVPIAAASQPGFGSDPTKPLLLPS